MKAHPGITTLSQKFQEPGHSQVQEVDTMHSSMDKTFKNMELHSPLAVVKGLCNITCGVKPFTIIQMRPDDFFDYKTIAKTTPGLHLNRIPYASIKQVHITGGHSAQIKLSHGEVNSQEVQPKTTRQGTEEVSIRRPKILIGVKLIEKKKKNHILSCFKHLEAPRQSLLEGSVRGER